MKDKENFKSLQRLLGLSIVVLLVAAGTAIYHSNTDTQPKQSKKPQTVTKSTECFSITVPKDYKTQIAANKCQFVAYTGESAKNPDNMVLIVPYQGKTNTRQEAAAHLRQEAPQAKTYRTLTVSGKKAIVIEGTNAKGTSKEHYNRFYVIYNLATYKPSAGDGATTNAFRVGFVMKSSAKSAIKPIIDSLTWKEQKTEVSIADN